MLHIRLFGTPQLRVHQLALTTVTGRELALLAYLAVTNKAHDRSTLVDLLWQDVAEAQARKNLRNLLYNLRQTIGAYLDITRQTVALQSDTMYWLDVQVFSQYWAAPQHHASEMLADVLNLYQGDFLDGFAIQEAPVFEAWMLTQRRALQEQAIQGFHRLAQDALASKEYTAGLAATRRILTMTPWNENAHRQQMLLLAHSGHRSAALAQYNLCQQALAEEYGVAPLPETTALYMQIKTGQLEQLSEAPVVPMTAHWEDNANITLAPPPSLATLNPGMALGLPQVNWDAIPASPRLLGRETELQQLEQWTLVDRSRVITLFGIGGQGKTALLAHLVHRLVEKAELAPPKQASSALFTRIFWFSVTTDTTVTHLLWRWIEQLASSASETLPVLPTQSTPPPLDLLFAHLIHHLRTQHCLWILDQADALWQNGADKDTAQEAFALLLRWVAESDHQSCLILAGREQPQALARLVRQSSAVRTLSLTGLSIAAGSDLLRQRGFTQPMPDLAALANRYGGNPLALILLTEILHDFPAHTLQTILQQETLLFADLYRLLKQQFLQLSPLAREMAVWLAIEQAPIPFELLWEHFLATNHASSVMEAYRRLQQASLIEHHAKQQLLTLAPLCKSYVIHYLIDQIVQEISSQEPFFSPITLNTYLLLNQQRPAEIQAAQKQLILQPILKQLLPFWGAAGLIRRLYDLLLMLTSTPLPTGRHVRPNLQALLTLLEAQAHNHHTTSPTRLPAQSLA